MPWIDLASESGWTMPALRPAATALCCGSLPSASRLIPEPGCTEARTRARFLSMREPAGWHGPSVLPAGGVGRSI